VRAHLSFYCADGHRWYQWREIIPDLATDYRVVAPDMRGLGDSSKPPDGQYDKRSVAADVHDLLKELGKNSYSVVGHDFGGAVAFALSTEYPEAVSRIAILEIALAGFGLEDYLDASREEFFWNVAFHMVPDIPEALVRGRERLYLTHFFRENSYDPTAIPEEAIDEYVRCYSTTTAPCGSTRNTTRSTQTPNSTRRSSHWVVQKCLANSSPIQRIAPRRTSPAG
jgi:pimeloyl-ACP methyl ester carboxylesterase